MERHLGETEGKMSMDILSFILYSDMKVSRIKKIILNKSSPNIIERRKAA